MIATCLDQLSMYKQVFFTANIVIGTQNEPIFLSNAVTIVKPRLGSNARSAHSACNLTHNISN